MASKRIVRGLVVGAVSATLMIGLIPAASAVGPVGNQGCTPGYWKVEQHFGSWQEYTPSQLIKAQFGDPNTFPSSVRFVKDLTFLQALKGDGGPGLAGGARILMRASIAAFLNAANDNVAFAYRRDQLPPDNPSPMPDGMRPLIKAALQSGSRDQMISLAATLDAANNGVDGCPLALAPVA